MSTETYSTATVSDAMIAHFSLVPAANVGDAQERFGVIAGLRPIWARATLTGRTFTVWTRSGDNLYIHKALDGALHSMRRHVRKDIEALRRAPTTD